jgi:hypothetical protein
MAATTRMRACAGRISTPDAGCCCATPWKPERKGRAPAAALTQAKGQKSYG